MVLRSLSWIAGVILSPAGTALAEELPLRFGGEARLRYEFADETARPDDAHGVTQLVRIAAESRPVPRLTVLVEGEAVFALVDRFDDGTGNDPARPVILDPGGLELNRALVSYRILDEANITIGRQKLNLDDQRFIGSSAFRQNDLTLDGVHLSSRLPGSATLQAGYFRRANRPPGGDNPAGRLRGDSYYANLNLPTLLGRLGAFHYAFDVGIDAGGTAIDIFSSQTSGVRLDGRWDGDRSGLEWEASYARQTDFAANPVDYSADYYLGGLRAYAGRYELGGRLEVLGAGDGQSFQTPVGTLHRFQGFADVFLVTPPDGIIDAQVSGQAALGSAGPFEKITLALAQHWFGAERGDAVYGRETDVSLTASVAAFELALVLADYRAEDFASDTTRVFLSLSWAF